MSWNVWWFGADPLTTSAFHSMGLKRPRHCLRHWNETGEPQNPQTLVRVTDMPCGFVYWPKFVNGASLRPEAFPIVFFAAGLLPHPRSLKGVLFLHKSRAFEQQVEVCCEASSIPECKCQKHIRAKIMDQSTSIYIYISQLWRRSKTRNCKMMRTWALLARWKQLHETQGETGQYCFLMRPQKITRTHWVNIHFVDLCRQSSLFINMYTFMDGSGRTKCCTC